MSQKKVVLEDPVENEQEKLLNNSDGVIQKEEQEKNPLFLFFSVAVAALGSFQYGYNLGVVNAPKAAITKCSNYTTDTWFSDCILMTDFEWSLVVAIFSIGGLLAGLVGGYFANSIGRRSLMIWTNILFIIGGLLMGLTSEIPWMVIGRFLVGFASGIETCTVNQLGIVVGILISQVLGIWLSTSVGWRFLLGGTIVPSLLQLLLLPFCSKSPVWLLNKGLKDSNFNKEATKYLMKLRGSKNIQKEEQQIKRAILETSKTKSISIKNLIEDSKKLLSVALGLQLAQQLSGVNTIIYFSTDVFEKAGIKDAAVTTVIVGIVNVVVTTLAAFLMDKAGRRKLLIIGQFFMALSYSVLVFAMIEVDLAPQILKWTQVLAIIFFVVSFAIGLGPIPWILMAELFSSKSRGLVMSLSTATNWFANFIVGLTFLSIQSALGAYTFLIYLIIVLFFFFFTIALVPETKGQELEGNKK